MFKFSAHIFACLILILAPPLLYADLPGNPADDTKAQSLERLRRSFKNSDSYNMRVQRSAAEVIASISMTPEKKASVKQLLTKSGLIDSGSKATVTGVVTKPVDTAKAASTLLERFKNAGKYAKNMGKASIPGFVGSAAFYGLMSGVDYVMDPENNTIQKPNPALDQNTPVQNYHEYRYYDARNNSWNASAVYLCRRDVTASSLNLNYLKVVQISETRVECWSTKQSDGSDYRYELIQREKNPAYKSDVSNPHPERVDASEAELLAALKKALESNNAALAAAIADALKAAYTQDNSEGQPKTTNPLVADAQNDMQRAVDSAFQNPTPTSTNKKPEGYYKITDGEKTIEGYVSTPDTSMPSDSTSVVNPDGSTSTTGSTQLPAFCDWASVMCDWYEWTIKDEVPEEEDLKAEEEEEIKLEKIQNLDWNPACHPTEEVEFSIEGKTEYFKILDLSHACEYAPYIKTVVIFNASMSALYILAGLRTKGGDDE